MQPNNLAIPRMVVIGLVKKMKQSSENFNIFKVNYVSRLANKEAHDLAKDTATNKFGSGPRDINQKLNTTNCTQLKSIYDFCFF